MSARHAGQFDTGAGAPQSAGPSDMERLTGKLDTMPRLHEDEGTQTRALADEVRRGVSEDLKPLLHAIIELLELAMSRMPPASRESSDPEAPPEAGPSGADDLPSALPQILTKSVEELVGKASARKMASSRASRRSVGNEAGGGERLGAWIPVTSGTSDS